MLFRPVSPATDGVDRFFAAARGAVPFFVGRFRAGAFDGLSEDFAWAIAARAGHDATGATRASSNNKRA